MKNNVIKKLREEKKLSVAELANILNMTRQNLYAIEQGKIALTEENQHKLCKIFNCEVNDLYNENYVLKNSVYLRIKFYHSLLQDNYKILNDINDYEEIEIPERLLKILEIKENSLIAAKIFEKNMEPVISKNDFIIIDPNNKKIENNKIYLINENDRFKIKRIRQASPFDSKITILSENQIDGEYPPYEVDISVAKNNILGQVIFYGRNII